MVLEGSLAFLETQTEAETAIQVVANPRLVWLEERAKKEDRARVAANATGQGDMPSREQEVLRFKISTLREMSRAFGASFLVEAQAGSCRSHQAI